MYDLCFPLLVLSFVQYPLITSKFADVEERWLPSRSTFKFSSNDYDYREEFGEIFFSEFAQETKKSEDCVSNCVHKYSLKTRYILSGKPNSDYSVQGEDVIVT